MAIYTHSPLYFMLVKLYCSHLYFCTSSKPMSFSVTMNADTMQVHTCMHVGYMHGAPYECIPCNKLNAERIQSPIQSCSVSSSYSQPTIQVTSQLVTAPALYAVYSVEKVLILHVRCRVLQRTITLDLNVPMPLLPYNVYRHRSRERHSAKGVACETSIVSIQPGPT